MATAQPVVWDGDAGDGDWFSADNWSTDAVPEGGDDVIADADQVISAAGNIEVGSLLARGSGLSVVAGLFSVAGSAQINNLTIDNCCAVDFITGGTMFFEGDSAFVARPVFMGGSYRHVDNARFLSGFVAESFLNLDGTARIATGWSGVADGVECNVGGTAELEPASSLTAANGGGWTVFGTVKAVEPEGADSPNPATFNGRATVFSGGGFAADTRRLEVNAGFSMAGGHIRVDSGGTVSVEPVDTAFISNVAISGEGTVDLASTLLRVSDLTGTVTSSVTAASGGQGLRIRSDLNIEAGARLESSGDLVLGPGDLVGDGTLAVTGGDATVANGFANDGRLEVAGGTLTIDRVVGGNRGQYNSVGGTIRLLSGAGLSGDASQGFVGLEILSGAVEIPASQPDSTIVVIDTPFSIFGGTLRVRWGEVQFRDRASLGGGTIDFGQTPGSTLPSVGFFGTSSETVFVVGGPAVQGRGRLVLGGGFSGVRPEIRVLSASWTVDLGSDADRDAHLRLRTTLTGDAPLINTGYMLIDGVPAIEGVLQNAGTARLEGQLSISGSLLNAGVFEMANSINLPDADPGDIVNTGLWRLTTSGRSINGALGSVSNIGVYEVVGPGPAQLGHNIVPSLNNIGEVRAVNARINVFQSPQVSGDGRLVGGSWIAGDNGEIRFPIDMVTITGAGTAVGGTEDAFPELEDVSTVEDGAELFATDGATWSAGDEDFILLNGGFFSATDGVVQTDGLQTENGGGVNVAPGATIDSAGPVRIGEDPGDGLPSVTDDIQGVLPIRRGSARPKPAGPGAPGPSTVITPLLDLWGAIRPGGADTVGVFDLQTDVVAHDTTTWDIDLVDGADPGSGADRVDVSGTVALAGTLALRTAPGFDAPEGASWTLMTAQGGITGVLGAVERTGPNAGALRVTVGADAVTVTVGCAADYNQDDQVNILDVIAFVTVWNGAGAEADYNADGVVNILDVIAFVADWNGGCS